MRLFLTKVWGWDTPVGPLQFSTSGWRDNALRQLEDGDRVVLVGTEGDQTPDDMKGRLLGVMEPSRELVMSLDFDVRASPGDFVDSKYKWPLGLLNLCAWSLPQRPKLKKQISDRKFNMPAVRGVVPLNDNEAARVLALDWREEALMQPTAQAGARMAKRHGAAKRTAPPPTTKRRGVMHMRRAPAYTYAMRIVGARTSAFKIGWAFDFKQRARQFNHAAMPSLGGLEYKPFLYHLWDTARQAYAMEQALLAKLSDRVHGHNGEIVTDLSDEALEAAWRAAVTVP
ncbi:GIY-YIG nuclease family protein [Cognatiyoonia sp. IB215182]|uniref:GIY-YIG nuclease family protein n=1 Tax=Cognatiyoonia sp. IB215182 TaxID=3097353 RepID=UPI002A15CE10|nr:GIY-YIG nuclease family protein [Cognatiyoonia sp. IB215182]MDX8355680.1 GIY-YIG nuclease family protein [Cognatiyoonia sp. IB215182]